MYSRVYRNYAVYFYGLWIHSVSSVQHSGHPYFSSSTMVCFFCGKLTMQHSDTFLKKMKGKVQSDFLRTWLFLAYNEWFTIRAIYKNAEILYPFIYTWSRTKFFSRLVNVICLKKESGKCRSDRGFVTFFMSWESGEKYRPLPRKIYLVRKIEIVRFIEVNKYVVGLKTIKYFVAHILYRIKS
jgi:hypothetical protein